MSYYAFIIILLDVPSHPRCETNLKLVYIIHTALVTINSLLSTVIIDSCTIIAYEASSVHLECIHYDLIAAPYDLFLNHYSMYEATFVKFVIESNKIMLCSI